MRVYNGRQKHQQRADTAPGTSTSDAATADANTGTGAAGPKETASESVPRNGQCPVPYAG